MKRFHKFVIAIFIAIPFLTGCYWNEDVGTNQVGVLLYKNEIQNVEGPGVYSAMGCFFCDIKKVSTDTLTFSVEDPEVLTSDNQAVSVKITIQARRLSDEDSIINIMTKWSQLIDDEALKNTISATAREGMKNGVRGFTLTELLDDRNGLASAISAQLEEDAKKYSGQIVSVTVENIGPSATYMGILSETANLKAQTDQERRRQELIRQQSSNDQLTQQQRVIIANEQVKAEQAETNVQVEIARRAGEVIAAQNAVYQLNPQAFELKRLELLKDVLNNKTIMFIPEGTDLNTFIGNMFNSTPIPVGP